MSAQSMKWLKAEKYHQYSTCKRYSITKGEAVALYCAWRTKAHPDGLRLITENIPTAAAARDVCARDAALTNANSVNHQAIRALKGMVST